MRISSSPAFVGYLLTDLTLTKILEDDPTPSRGSQLMRASSLILSSLGFIHDLRTGQLPPDVFRNVPLDMYQYSRLYVAPLPPGGD